MDAKEGSAHIVNFPAIMTRPSSRFFELSGRRETLGTRLSYILLIWAHKTSGCSSSKGFDGVAG